MTDSRYRGVAGPPVPRDPYIEAWRDLRRRNLVAMGVALGTIPVSLLAVFHYQARAVYVVGAWWLFSFVLRSRAARFLCPACGQRFNPSGWRRRGPPWPRACAHCGIGVGSRMPSWDG